MRISSYLLLAASLWLLTISTAFADNNCVFRSARRTLQLQSDCWTDATLLIPDRTTLDGRGRSITALDPAGGHFLGAVVRNAGATAHVRNLTIEAGGLANVCDSEGPPDERLRGISFVAASGTIVGNQVRSLNQTSSGCQEGIGIEVRGQAPAQGATLQRVTITNNLVAAYQKTGIFVGGAVAADIERNRVTGLGPVDLIAQNGIQLGYGARGRIRANHVEQNIFTGSGAASTGILLLEAGSPVVVERNLVEDNDIGIHVASTSDVLVRRNEVSGSTFDGIAIDGRQALTQGNQLVSNRLADNAIGLDLFGSGATANEAFRNRIEDSSLAGIQLAFGASGNALEQNLLRRNAYGAFVSAGDNDIIDNVVFDSDAAGLHVEGDGNDVRDNAVDGSTGLDIENTGANVYLDNSCTTSSGPPVDCP